MWNETCRFADFCILASFSFVITEVNSKCDFVISDAIILLKGKWKRRGYRGTLYLQLKKK